MEEDEVWVGRGGKMGERIKRRKRRSRFRIRRCGGGPNPDQISVSLSSFAQLGALPGVT